MSKVRAIGNKVVFKFSDEVQSNRFTNVTESGIVYKNTEDTVNQPRWGIVLSIGPDVKENIKVGDEVLIEPLRWTEKLSVDGASFWATTENDIILVKE